MIIHHRVEQKWKEAMKARDPSKDALSLILTEFKNKWIERRLVVDQTVGCTGLPDEMALTVLSKMAKQRLDSISDYQKGGRQDLVDKESAELAVIESFLPTKMTETELREIIQMTIMEVGYAGPKDTGKLMKILMPKVRGRADSKRIQEIVKEVVG